MGKTDSVDIIANLIYSDFPSVTGSNLDQAIDIALEVLADTKVTVMLFTTKIYGMQVGIYNSDHVKSETENDESFLKHHLGIVVVGSKMAFTNKNLKKHIEALVEPEDMLKYELKNISMIDMGKYHLFDHNGN